MTGIESRTVDWWSVHSFVAPWLDTAGDYPMAGTLAWQELSSNDPRKWAALLDGASHHALRVETSQEQRAEASRAIAAAVDWPKVAGEVRQRSAFREAHPWSRRKAVR
ncbi:MAG: DUF2742 domain-containing protein [Mycobacterium sp.]|nr:MAG: DUF2742 domain-containing protein [Mycobacterium sp.]